MLSEISVHQLREWRAYASLEPFDETRADTRAAQICTTLVNINRSKNATVRPISDFVLKFGDAAKTPKPQQDWRTMKSIGMAAYKASQASQQRKRRARG